MLSEEIRTACTFPLSPFQRAMASRCTSLTKDSLDGEPYSAEGIS